MAFVDTLGETKTTRVAGEPAVGTWDGDRALEKSSFVDTFDIERPPLPTPKPQRRSTFDRAIRYALSQGRDLPSEFIGEDDSEPATAAAGAFSKKGIPLPDWFLEGKYEAGRGQGQRRPLIPFKQRPQYRELEPGSVYPTYEETGKAIGPVARAIAEVGGSTVAPSGMMGAFARGAKPLAKIPGYLYEALANYRKAPVTSHLADVAISGGLGGTARGSAEAAGVEDPLALSLAEMGGQLSPLALSGAARLGTRAMPDVFGASAARRRAGATLQSEAGPDALPRLETAMAEAPAIRGYQSQTGDLLDNAFLQQTAMGHTDRAALNRDNARALRNELETGTPEGNAEAAGRRATELLLDSQARVRANAVQRRNQAEAEALAAEETGATARQEAEAAETTAARALPEGSEGVKTTASEKLAGLAREAEADARRHGGELFEQVTEGVDTTNLKSSLYNTKAAIERVKRLAYEEGREDALPAALKKVKDTQGNETGGHLEDYLAAHKVPNEQGFTASAPYSRTKGMRERLQEEMRDRATPPKTKRYTAMLLEGLEKDLDESLPSDVLARDRAARDYWREEVVGRFQHPNEGPKNPVADVLEGKPAGPSMVRPGEAGKRTGEAFVKTFGPEPVDLGGGTRGSEAHSAVRDWVLSHAGKRPETVRAFLTEHAPFLDNFPTLRADLEAAAVARGEAEALEKSATIAERQATREAGIARSTGRAEERRVLSEADRLAKTSIAGRLAKEDPAAVAAQISSVSEAKRARNLFKKDPEAWAGMQKVYYDRLLEEVLPARQSGPVKNETINRFLRDNGKVMDQVLEPDQLNRIQRVVKALQIAGRAEGLKQAPGESQTTPLRDQSTALLARLTVGAKLGPIATAALKKIGVSSAEDAAALLKQAAVDPELFRELMKEPGRVAAGKIAAGLAARGAALAGVGEVENEEGVLWSKLRGE